jgi:hypothetical protein
LNGCEYVYSFWKIFEGKHFGRIVEGLSLGMSLNLSTPLKKAGGE